MNYDFYKFLTKLQSKKDSSKVNNNRKVIELIELISDIDIINDNIIKNIDMDTIDNALEYIQNYNTDINYRKDICSTDILTNMILAQKFKDTLNKVNSCQSLNEEDYI